MRRFVEEADRGPTVFERRENVEAGGLLSYGASLNEVLRHTAFYALAALDVTALRVRVELARSHVFDHTLTQRTDSVGFAHGELHSE